VLYESLVGTHHNTGHVHIQVLKDSVIFLEQSCEHRLIIHALIYSDLSDKGAQSLIIVPRPR
jgi:hypothetical protein